MRKYRQSLLAGLLALLLLGLTYWAGQGQQVIRKVSVVALKQDIPTGTCLLPEHLTAVEIADHPALAGYVKDPEQAVGLWSSTELKAGELLLASRIASTSGGVSYPNPQPGHRLMTLELRAGDANGFYLAAGNLIDLHLVPKQTTGDLTDTIRNVPIVALLGTDGQPLEVPLDNTNGTALLCLDLDKTQAGKLAEAMSRAYIRVSAVNEPE